MRQTLTRDGGHDVDSSTELWDEPEEDQPHCSHCSTSLHDQYTDTLRIKIKQQQMTLLEMKVCLRMYLDVVCVCGFHGTITWDIWKISLVADYFSFI